MYWKLVFSFVCFQNNSWALFLKHEFGATLLYRLPSKEFLEKMVFEGNVGNIVILETLSTFPHLNCEVIELMKSKVYPLFPNAFDFLCKVHFFYHYPFKEEHSQLLELLLKYQEFESFLYYRLPSEKYSVKWTFGKRFVKSWNIGNFVSISPLISFGKFILHNIILLKKRCIKL